MYRPQVDINIGENNFGFCTDLEVASSWQSLSDTAKITIPTKFVKDGQTIIVGQDNVFKRGDPVTISSGYYPALNQIFTGFVRKITPSLPLVIECEDLTWILKQTNVTFSLANTTLQNMLEVALSTAIAKTTSPTLLQPLQSITLNCLDCNLGSFRATRVSLTQILDELKKTYSLISYFRGTVLNVGFAYNLVNPTTFTYTIEKDVIDHKLDYIRLDDVRIKVHGISILPNNTKIEVDGGDPDGEQRTLLKYNVTQADLQGMVQREADRFRYEGWRGSFQTFATDNVKHGDIINLLSLRLPEMNGQYYVSAVTNLGGVDGQFNNISLGAKVSAGVTAF